MADVKGLAGANGGAASARHVRDGALPASIAYLTTSLCEPHLKAYHLAATHTGRTCGTSLFARHFWSGAKPWRASSPPCLRYFSFLDAPPFANSSAPHGLSDGSRPGSNTNSRVQEEELCLAMLRRKRHSLISHYAGSAKADKGCGSPIVPLFPVL